MTKDTMYKITVTTLSGLLLGASIIIGIFIPNSLKIDEITNSKIRELCDTNRLFIIDGQTYHCHNLTPFLAEEALILNGEVSEFPAPPPSDVVEEIVEEEGINDNTA